MKNIILIRVGIVFIFLGHGVMLLAQTYSDNQLYVQLNSPELKPDGSGRIDDHEFEQILQGNSADLEVGFPHAATTDLQNVYLITLNSGEVDSLMRDITGLNNSGIGYVEKIPLPQLSYDPEDWFWQGHINGNFDWGWWLEIIEADKAWDITRGDPNLKIAVSDNGFNIDHPDLSGKIDPSFDFVTGNSFNAAGHGSSIASILAGETAEVGTVPQGEMASIGFNTKVMCTLWGSLQSLHEASLVHDVRVISISWHNGICGLTSTALLVEQEVLNNGTIVVRAAGNGNAASQCFGNPLYPFSGVQDDRVIVVTGTDNTDSHFNTMNSVPTVSHYPAIDIAAPCYDILSAKETNPNDPNDWPYFGWGGTSQSTPIVSGTIALMLSVNTCLEREDVDHIIKTTADPIVEAANYPGQVGAGRINAYQAVLMAQTYGEQFMVTSSTTWSNDRYVKGKLVIDNGATLTLTGNLRMADDARIEVKPGSKLIIDG